MRYLPRQAQRSADVLLVNHPVRQGNQPTEAGRQTAWDDMPSQLGTEFVGAAALVPRQHSGIDPGRVQPTAQELPDGLRAAQLVVADPSTRSARAPTA
jgi:hypothetical protein